LYGAIRPVWNGTTNDWIFISSINHDYSSNLLTVTSDSINIYVTYKKTPVIQSVIVTTDEATAGLGMFVGASVDTTSMYLRISKFANEYFEATYNTTTSSWSYVGNTLGRTISFDNSTKLFTFNNSVWRGISENYNIEVISSTSSQSSITNRYLALKYNQLGLSPRFRILKLTGDYLQTIPDGLKIRVSYNGLVRVNPLTYNFTTGTDTPQNFWIFGIQKK
jgi:hypothetical protein